MHYYIFSHVYMCISYECARVYKYASNDIVRIFAICVYGSWEYEDERSSRG